jgi:hypothetical protein
MTVLKVTFQEVVEMVKREAKGDALEHEKKWLYSPKNRKIWKAALQAAIDDCISQFEEWDVRLDRLREEVRDGLISQQAYETGSAAYELWRKKAGRYRLGLEQKLLEITLDDKDHEPIVDKLVEAIRSHKDGISDSRETTATDMKLWSLLDTVDNAVSADKM